MRPLTVVILAVAAGMFAPASEAAVTRGFPLTVGEYSKQVLNAEYLLHRKTVTSPRRGFAVRTLEERPNRSYNRATAKATQDAYWKLGWPTWYVKSPLARQFGPYLRDVLLGLRTRPLSYRLAAGRRVNRATLFVPTPVSSKLVNAVILARDLIRHRSLIHYSQRTRMTLIRWRVNWPPLRQTVYEDCSSFVTGIYWKAGLPDPNGYIAGRQYSGYGFTGTLAQRGRIVWYRGQSLSHLKPGDLIFYGRYPFSHVTIYLGLGRVASNGSEGGPYDLPVFYRREGPYYARRYA